MMNIVYLTSFYYLVKLGSVSKAAEKLTYAQSTVSYHLKSLQNDYGLLYVKKAGNIDLTEKGQLIFEFIEEFIEKEEKLQKKINPTQDTLRIGTISSIMAFILTEKLAGFRRSNQHLKIEIVLKEESQLIDMLLNDQLDCIYIFDEKIDIASAYSVSKKEVPFDIISKGMLDIEHLDEYRMILTEKNCSYRAAFLKEWTFKEKVVVTLSLESPKEIIRSLQASNEMAFLPRYVTDQLPNAVFDRQELILDTPFYLQFIYDSKNSLAVDFFKKVIVET